MRVRAFHLVAEGLGRRPCHFTPKHELLLHPCPHIYFHQHLPSCSWRVFSLSPAAFQPFCSGSATSAPQRSRVGLWGEPYAGSGLGRGTSGHLFGKSETGKNNGVTSELPCSHCLCAVPHPRASAKSLSKTNPPVLAWECAAAGRDPAPRCSISC